MMISDSSQLEDTAAVLEELLKDNDFFRPDTRFNSFDKLVKAFPYAELLVRMNKRINQLENFLKEKGLDLNGIG